MSSDVKNKSMIREGAEPDAGCSLLRPRDRIVATARNLFHRHGIRGIGVDAIAEAAGTNKMTLYRHFGSKDDLVCECLRAKAREAQASWTELEKAYPGDPRAQLHAWGPFVGDCAVTDRRDCDFLNAAVELTEKDHPAHRVIEEFKTSYRTRLEELCRAAGIAQPAALADTLLLLLEGARVSMQSVGAEGPAARFVQTCEAVIASFERQAVAAG